MTNFEKVKHWMRVAGQACPDRPRLVDGKVLSLRKKLMREEIIDELFPAMDGEDMVEIADGLADALYVVYGTAAAYGIDIDKIFDIVHENNMTKFNKCRNCDGSGWMINPRMDCSDCNGEGWVPILREDGKVMKNESWVPPNLKPALGLS